MLTTWINHRGDLDLLLNGPSLPLNDGCDWRGWVVILSAWIFFILFYCIICTQSEVVTNQPAVRHKQLAWQDK